MKNLLHGKVSFFVMAADFIPVWYLKGNAVSLQDKLHSKELLIYDAGWKTKQICQREEEHWVAKSRRIKEHTGSAWGD